MTDNIIDFNDYFIHPDDEVVDFVCPCGSFEFGMVKRLVNQHIVLVCLDCGAPIDNIEIKELPTTDPEPDQAS